jgi:hypothetical protein
VPLHILYKIVHLRPEPQGGRLFTVFCDEHWVNCTALDPFYRQLEECTRVPYLMSFPYYLCPNDVVPPPLPDHRYSELFTLYPVSNGVAQALIGCWVARYDNPELSPAHWFSVAMGERDMLYDDPLKYPHFVY